MCLEASFPLAPEILYIYMYNALSRIYPPNSGGANVPFSIKSATLQYLGRVV